MTVNNNNETSAEQKGSFWTSIIDTRKPYDTEGVPFALYLLIAVLSIVILQLGLLTQSGVAGAYGVLWTIGLLFFAIGERVRLLKALVGGGLVVAWAGAAMIARVELISEEDIQFIQAQMIGNGFLYFVLAALVIGSVLSVQSTVLKNRLCPMPQ